MTRKQRAWRLLGAVLVTLALALGDVARAADLRIAIQQAQAGDARKYQGILDYLAKKGIPAKFVTVSDYQSAGVFFASGRMDLMFSGSGVAGTMMIKGIAAPLVRPDFLDGSNTYSAVVVAPKGSKPFDGTAAWFAGKKVIFAPLASAGEFFFRSLGPSKAAAALKAAADGAALDALARGQADVAVLKNHVWDREKARYPQLELVGADTGANPDNVLIASTKLDASEARKVAEALLALGADPTPEARAATAPLKIKGFLPASPKDFEHTLDLLAKAGVTKAFEFTF